MGCENYIAYNSIMQFYNAYYNLYIHCLHYLYLSSNLCMIFTGCFNHLRMPTSSSSCKEYYCKIQIMKETFDEIEISIILVSCKHLSKHKPQMTSFNTQKCCSFNNQELI